MAGVRGTVPSGETYHQQGFQEKHTLIDRAGVTTAQAFDETIGAFREQYLMGGHQIAPSNKMKRVVALTLLWAIAPLPLARVDGAEFRDRVLNEQIDHGFGFISRESNPAEATEDNGLVLALRLDVPECLAFKCSRAYNSKWSLPLPLTVFNAQLVELGERGTITPISTRQEKTLQDSELQVVCPNVGARTSYLIYPMNKRDIAEAAGFASEKIGQPMVLKLGVALEIFSFKDGNLVSRGFLVSDPFYVRITEEAFEISVDSPE